MIFLLQNEHLSTSSNFTWLHVDLQRVKVRSIALTVAFSEQMCQQDQLSAAIDDARVLLAPQQQPLPDALRTAIEAATRTWDSGRLEAACAHLQQAAALAGEMGYL